MNKEQKEKQKIIQKRFQRKQKARAIEHYGGKCLCGENRIECLTIVKIGKKNGKDRKTQISNWLRQKGYPKEYRVICLNCLAYDKISKGKVEH